MKQLKMTPALGTITTMLVRTPGRKKEYVSDGQTFSPDSTMSLRSSTHMHVLIELWKRQMAWAIKRHFMQSGSPSASFLDGPSRPPW